MCSIPDRVLPKDVSRCFLAWRSPLYTIPTWATCSFPRTDETQTALASLHMATAARSDNVGTSTQRRGQLQLCPRRQSEDCQILIRLPLSLHQHPQWLLQKSNVCDSLFVALHASTVGWGAHLSAAGCWSLGHRTFHINNLEFKAVILAVSHVLRNS